MIEYSAAKLNNDTYVPYVDVIYTDKLALDKDYMRACKIHNVNIIDVMLDGYRQDLEKTLPAKLKELGMIV